MNIIITQLKELGLTEKQAKIYLALVEIGKGTAYAIAKQAKLKRSITYVILEELRLKGLVLKIPHDKNQIFIAKDPRKLFAEKEEKLVYAKKILPELLARASKDSSKVTTYFFEGNEGIKQALQYGLEKIRDQEILCYYAKADNGSHSIPKFYFDHYNNLNEAKVKIRGFAPAHNSNKVFRDMDKGSDNQILVLPETEFPWGIVTDRVARIEIELRPESLPLNTLAFLPSTELPMGYFSHVHVEGSQDRFTWKPVTEIDQKPVPVIGDWSTWTFHNDAAFRFYRLTFSPTPASQWLAISEFRLANSALLETLVP